MGTLKSTTNWTGSTFLDVTLGLPTTEEYYFCWDHIAFPNGIIDSEGTIFIEVPSE